MSLKITPNNPLQNPYEEAYDEFDRVILKIGDALHTVVNAIKGFFVERGRPLTPAELAKLNHLRPIPTLEATLESKERKARQELIRWRDQNWVPGGTAFENLPQ